jgi:hypothetical protein
LKSEVRALVLSSTQPKHPHGGLPWVCATLHAIEVLCGQGHGFVASVGTLPWELALWKIASLRAPVHVVCPVAHSVTDEVARAQIEREFELEPCLATWHFLRSGTHSERRKDTWLLRDAAALDSAEAIFPISLRNKGKMQAALHRGDLRERVDCRFQVPYEPAPEARTWQLPQSREPTVREPAHRDAQLLMHFTRACDGPWPGESRAQFYASVAASSERYPRDGLSTLRRIIDEKRIRASTFRIRGHGATVSLTARAPADALSLVRWRSRYARFSFEPYAIGLSREAAVRAGAKPVVYDPGASRTEPGRDSPLHQGRGGGWEAEREWRIQGDLDLAGFDRSELVVFTATAAEAESLRSRCPLRVIDFGCANRA